MLNPKNHSGYFFIFITCLSSAASFVFISHLSRNSDPFTGIFLTFLYASLFFLLLNIKNIKKLVSLSKSNLKPLFLLNLATCLSWLGTFLALKYIDPATKICIGFGLIAITNYFIFTPLGSIKKHKRRLMIVFLILASMILIISQNPLISSRSNIEILMLGIAWSIVGGISGGFIGINAEKIAHAGFKATQVLATRFLLLIIVSGIFLAFSKPLQTSTFEWAYYPLSSIVVVFLPLLTYQLAIKSLGALLVALIEPFTPIITYFLQISFMHYSFNPIFLLLLILSSTSVLLLLRSERKNNLAVNKHELEM